MISLSAEIFICYKCTIKLVPIISVQKTQSFLYYNIFINNSSLENIMILDSIRNKYTKGIM